MKCRRRKKITLIAAAVTVLGLMMAIGWLWWPKFLLKKAEEAIAANDLDRAEKVLHQLIRHSPQNARAHFLLAQALRRLRRSNDAEESLRQAQRLGYSEEEGKRELALNEAAKRFHPSIAYALRKLLDNNPDDLELLEALAQGYASIHDWREADPCFTKLIELEPHRAELYFERGQLRQMAPDGQGHDKAAADFREVLLRIPDHFEARLCLAQCLLSDANLTGAQQEFRVCRKIDLRRPEPIIGLAICAVEDQDLPKAQALLREALTYDPDSVVALAMLGDLSLLRQQYAEAIPYFQKVLALDPANKAAHLKLAQAFRSSGMLPEAKNQEDRFQRLQKMEERRAPSPR